MKHLMKYLSTPLAFAAVFLLFGTPSAVATDILLPSCGVAEAYAGGEDGMEESGLCAYQMLEGSGWRCVRCDEARDRRDNLTYYGIGVSVLAGIMGASGVGIFGMVLLSGTAGASFASAKWISSRMEEVGC